MTLKTNKNGISKKQEKMWTYEFERVYGLDAKKHPKAVKDYLKWRLQQKNIWTK